MDRTVAPAVRAFSNLYMPELRRVTLDNGITLSIADGCNHDVNRLSLMWNGGTAEVQAPSVATLTMQLMREGSALHSGEELSKAFDFNGSWIKGVAQSHSSSVVMHSINSRMDTVLPLFAEMVAEPEFPEQALSAQRESLAGSVEIARTRVDNMSQRAVRDMIFGKSHPLAKDETPDEIRSISRGDLIDFHASVIGNALPDIFIAGRITPAIEDAVNRWFGQFKPKGEPLSLNVVKPEPVSGSAVNIVDYPGAKQSSVKIAIPTIGREHSDYIDLRLAVIALGGYFGSRLMTNIREEKGLTYGINAGLYGYREGGVVLIGAQTDNSTAGTVIAETISELRRLKSGDMDGDEIMRLKRFEMSQLA
ncbi:MAG: insulinase family protein, partial [Muribaculaceae bacterium]|nr:insulinase family protein [Muribaculaceae bacterium]